MITVGTFAMPRLSKSKPLTSTVEIDDTCIHCGACTDSPSQMIIEEDDDNYIYDETSDAILWTSSDGKIAGLSPNYFDEWEELRDKCPQNSIKEMG